MHITVWGLDALKSTGYPNWLLINLKPEFLELNTRMDCLPSSQMCVLMEDGDHRTMLRRYYAACSYNLEISDLLVTDSLNVNCTVRYLDDANVCASYTTVCTSIDEGTGFVSMMLAHGVVRWVLA